MLLVSKDVTRRSNGEVAEPNQTLAADVSPTAPVWTLATSEKADGVPGSNHPDGVSIACHPLRTIRTVRLTEEQKNKKI